MVFEGHSTDYQPPKKLKEMVQDGIAIIKVGPALSWALREGLFALSFIEKELIDDVSKRANFIETLDKVMLKNTKHWEKYYTGTEKEVALSRKYSFSDRCRYYFINPDVEASIQKLFKNMEKVKIPLGLLHQYMPNQYNKVRDGRLELKARELVKDFVISIVDEYNYAVKYNYMIGGVI